MAKSPIRGHGIERVAVDARGRLWFGGASVFLDDGYSVQHVPKPEGGVSAFLPRADGTVWIATTRGLFVYDQGALERLSEEFCERFKHITALVEDDAGRVWAGTYDGHLWRYDHGTFRLIRTLDTSVKDLCRDQAGRLWVGTYGHGLYCYDTTRFQLFREDLYYRLHAFPVHLPPLRQRREDIPALAAYFIEGMAAHLGRPAPRLNREALALLIAYDWPGNVRELKHTVERAVVGCPGPMIRKPDIALQGPGPVAPAADLVTLDEHERRYILVVLEKTGWILRGPHGAAAILGKHEATVRNRMRKLGIQRRVSTGE